ncbi:hypothetical protein [Staphylococcus xylosus]|uniref:hypothetical protein n=1 Tax=Staphylococcus xylosus TaxID=1288 RepID=UPI003F54DDA6
MEHILHNWANILKVIVSLISIATFIRVFWFERSKLDINLIEWEILENKYLDTYISFINSSKLPTSITNIQIIYDKKVIGEIHNYTQLVYDDDPKDSFKVYSNALPLNIQPFSSEKDLFRIELNENLPLNKNIIFKVITSRKNKNIKIKNFSIPSWRNELYKKLKHHKKTSNKNKD